MRVCTVVGTRPEIIKLSRITAALDKAVEHVVVHSGQNYDRELNDIFYEEMKIRKPDYQLETGGSIPDMMSQLQELLPRIKPDLILILGDTNSCFAVAYVCARLKIKLFHLEAGNRCFNQFVPEEINRVVIDHLPGIQLPYSERARENLTREGIPTDRIIKVGSPMAEVLAYYKSDIDASSVLSRLNLTKGDYFLVSMHREEGFSHFSDFIAMLNRLAGLGKRVIVTTHPRTRKRIDAENVIVPLVNRRDGSGVVFTCCEFHKPFGMFDYVHLEQHAFCTLSDSGTISEESSILGFPALMLREVDERPEAVEEGGVIHVGFDVDRVIEALPVAQTQMCTPDAYCPMNVAQKVVRIVLSYK